MIGPRDGGDSGSMLAISQSASSGKFLVPAAECFLMDPPAGAPDMTEDTRRLTRRQLYDLVWKTPVDNLARQFGMSGRGLGKLCERHAIPVPQRD